MESNLDPIDQMIVAWQSALPELDPSGLELVGRVIVLAQHLEQSVNRALSRHKLTLGQFDILATLRRHDTEAGLTPTELLRSVMLSSGGMTARLKRLEEEGLIVRRPATTDRRQVAVKLTAKGKRRIEAATATRFEEAHQSAPDCDPAHAKLVINFLRNWLIQLQVQNSEQPARL